MNGVTLITCRITRDPLSIEMLRGMFPERVLGIICNELHLPPERRDDIAVALCQFLQIAHDTAHAAPTTIIDRAWHVAILNTLEYEEFCLRGFGRMIHHSMPLDTSEAVANDAHIAETRRAAEQRFGKLNMFWDTQSGAKKKCGGNCGSCKSTT